MAGQHFTLRDRQKLRRKDRIFRAAVQLFRENSFADATATDIAKAANVSRGTFFNYFPYKEAVLLQLGQEILAQLRQKAQAEYLQKATPETVLQNFWRGLAQATEEDAVLLMPLVYELMNPDPARAKYAFENMPLLETIEEIVAPISAYGFREGFDATSISRLVADIYLVSVLRHSARQSGQGLYEQMEIALDALLNGVLAARKK